MSSPFTSFLKLYYPFITIDKEVEDFFKNIEEDDWEELMMCALRLKRHQRSNIGVYDLYLSILHNDSLWRKYKEFIPKYKENNNYLWFEKEIVLHAVYLSELCNILTPAQRNMVEDFLFSYGHIIPIPKNIKFEYVSPLSKYGEWLSIICNRIYERIMKEKEKDITTELLFNILNEVKM